MITSWIHYDASSVQLGDVIRISKGDIIPADTVVLFLNPNSSPPQETVLQEWKEDFKQQHVFLTDSSGVSTSLVIDYRRVLGQASRPTLWTTDPHPTTTSSSSSLMYLYCGGTVIQGSCIGVVVSIGMSTVLGQLIQYGLWPPQMHQDLSQQIHNHIHPEYGSIYTHIQIPQPPMTWIQQFINKLGYRSISNYGCFGKRKKRWNRMIQILHYNKKLYNKDDEEEEDRFLFYKDYYYFFHPWCR